MPGHVRKVPCDPVRALYEFSVTGWGNFPIDMLRYDSCWPKRESMDSGHIYDSISRIGSTKQRVVTLVGTHAPTEDRWSSFGWRVVG